MSDPEAANGQTRPVAAAVEEADAAVIFSNGLVGCPNWTRFVLLSDPEEPGVGVLQCLDEPEVSILVANPVHLLPDYQPRVSRAELQAIGLEDLEQAVVLCTLCTSEGSASITANLLGPLLINPATRQARQVVLADSGYSPRHPLPQGDPAPGAERAD